MNKNTIVLILLFLLVLIPTGVTLNAYTIERFERLSNESLVAYSAAYIHKQETGPISPITPIPLPTSSTCDKCRGTKTVVTGDGVTRIPCPCGAACKCKPSGSDVVKRNRKVLLLTDTKTCLPCIQVDKNTIPAMEAVGWKFGKAETNKVGENFDNHVEIFEKEGGQPSDFGYNLVFSTSQYPTWVLIENNKEVRRWTRFMNGYGVKRLYDNQTILTTDITLIPYEVK